LIDRQSSQYEAISAVKQRNKVNRRAVTRYLNLMKTTSEHSFVFPVFSSQLSADAVVVNQTPTTIFGAILHVERAANTTQDADAVNRFGFARDDERAYEKMCSLARLATIEYAVCAALLSTASGDVSCARFDRDGNWTRLLDVEKYLVCSKSIAVYVLSMCASLYIDETRLALTQTLYRQFHPTPDRFDEDAIFYTIPAADVRQHSDICARPPLSRRIRYYDGNISLLAC
jgi:hypothetical protein